MGTYRFVLRSRAGHVEKLGSLPLRSDREAVAFGETVFRESMQGNRKTLPDAVIVVTQGERTVGEIQISP